MWFTPTIEFWLVLLLRLGLVFAAVLVLACLAGTGYGLLLLANATMGLHGVAP